MNDRSKPGLGFLSFSSFFFFFHVIISSDTGNQIFSWCSVELPAVVCLWTFFQILKCLHLFFLIYFYSHKASRLERGLGSCCEQHCTSVQQEPVAVSKGFIISIVKRDNIQEWKQANGDRGTCPRSKICLGPDSWLAQPFPPWPLLQHFAIGWAFPLAFPRVLHHLLGSHLLCGQTWEEMAARRGQTSKEMALQLACRIPSPVTSSCQSHMLHGDRGETHSRQLWNVLPLGKFPFELLSIKGCGLKHSFFLLYIFTT